MTGMSAIGGPAAGAAVRGLIDGRGMVATLDRRGREAVTIISAAADSG